MSPPALLRGVDLAAFAVALVARLRARGVTVSASGPAAFVAAVRDLVPSSRTQLYWAARLTLVNRAEDLAAFDAVFEAAVPAAGRRDEAGPQTDGLPWTTRPPSLRAAGAAADATAIPDVLPSRIVARDEEPFDKFDPADLRLIGT